jgi:hypothetical protein
MTFHDSQGDPDMNTARRSSAFATLGFAAVLALATALPAAAADLWFHVEVHETGGDNANVKVNLPISLVESMLPMLEDASEIEDGHIVIDDSEVSVDDLRRVLDSLLDSPDATFAEVETDDERIVFFKDGPYLRVETDASAEGTEIRARFPIAVLEALVSGTGNELDVAAALRALADHGAGELVAVRDHDATVRVWIDDLPEAD